MGLDLYAWKFSGVINAEEMLEAYENGEYEELPGEPISDSVRRSYGSFMALRRQVAGGIGINLDDMFGFHNEMLDKKTGFRPWEELKPDPIHDFLHHSDCDGWLSPEQCRQIAPRLRALLEPMQDTPLTTYGLEIAALFDLAAAKDAYVIFR